MEMKKNPRVIGVKNSSMPVQDIQNYKAWGGEDFVVFNGPDEQFIGGRSMGACAGIGGTYGAMPELFLKMNALFKENRMEEARKIQFAVNEIITLLCSSHGNMYAMSKEVLKLSKGLNVGSVRSPLSPLTQEDLEIAKKTAKVIDETVARFV